MSAKRNDSGDEAIITLQRDLDQSAERRRFIKPMRPGFWLDKVMKKQGYSINDVAQATGLSTSQVSALITGEKEFNAEICHGLEEWLGKSFKVLLSLQASYRHFKRFGERPVAPTIDVLHDIGERARRYVRSKGTPPKAHRFE